MHFPFPMIISVRQFNFHFTWIVLYQFFREKTLIGDNTFIRMCNEHSSSSILSAYSRFSSRSHVIVDENGECGCFFFYLHCMDTNVFIICPEAIPIYVGIASFALLIFMLLLARFMSTSRHIRIHTFSILCSFYVYFSCCSLFIGKYWSLSSPVHLNWMQFTMKPQPTSESKA